MSTQNLIVNFKSLAELSPENLIKTIPPDQAVQVTIDSYNASEASGFEIYKLWATSFFQTYELSQIGEESLYSILKLFTTEIEELLNECRECITEEQNSKLFQFLDFSIELFTWIRSVASEIPARSITLFLCFGLSTISAYLRCNSSFKQNGLIIASTSAKLIRKSLELLTMILSTVAEHPDTFCFGEDSGDLYRNMFSLLSGVGEQTPKLDIKATVETWKCITKLASQNIEHTSDDIALLRSAMSFLANEIGRNIQTVYKKESLDEPIRQIENYIKVTNFYLRLLQKFATNFADHVNFPICEEFLKTLAIILNPPVYIEQTPVHKVVTEYVTKGFRELIPLANKSTAVFEILLSKESRIFASHEEFIQVLLELLETALRANEVACLDPKMVAVALEKAVQNLYMIQRPSFYNRFVEVMAALFIHNPLQQVHIKLIGFILQHDITIALTAIDIWCIIFRVSNHSSRLTHFTFWSNINEKFARFSNQLPAVYVEVLLKNLYNLLNEQEKRQIWNSALPNSERFILAIGLNEMHSTKTMHFLINDIGRLLKDSKTMTPDTFYTLVYDLKVLTSVDFCAHELIDLLVPYLDIAMKNKKLTLLVQSILDFIGSKLEAIECGVISKILTQLTRNLHTFEDLQTKMSLVGFLKNILKTNRLAMHSEEILKTLQSETLIQTVAYMDTSIHSNPATNEDIFKSILKKRSVWKTKRSHECCAKEPVVHINKKIKTDEDNLVELLERNTNELQTLATSQPLSSLSRGKIQRIINQLERITS